MVLVGVACYREPMVMSDGVEAKFRVVAVRYRLACGSGEGRCRLSVG